MAPNTKNIKACKAMKNLGYSEKIVKPVLKELLKLYEKDWTLIEEDNYQVLLHAILESEEQKAHSKNWEHFDEDEVEENEPPLKRSKLSSQKTQSSESFYVSILNSSNEPENEPNGKQCIAESISRKRKNKDIKLNAHVSKYRHGKGKSSSSPVPLKVVVQAEETDFVSDDESDESRSLAPLAHLESSVETGKLHDDDLAFEEEEFGKSPEEAAFESEPLPLSYDSNFCNSSDSPRFLLQGNSNEKCPITKGNCSIFPEVKDISSMHCLLPKDAYFIGDSSDLKGNNSETMNFRQSEAEKNEIDAQEYLKLDIAFSSRGEVKISLMVESSPRSGFHVPNLEEVLKQVEDQCLRSYQIPQTDISISTLMKEMCECFLAAGTTSTHTGDVGSKNVMSSPGMSENPDSKTGSSGGNYHQLSLCSTTSKCPIRTQNLLELPHQIPRFVGSIQLDLSCCRIHINVDLNVSSEMERNIMELSRCAPSSSGMMIVQKHCSHFIRDITKGQEAYEISLINEINGEQYPIFHYIPQNVTYKNAFVRFTLARISEENCCSNCSEDCFSLEIPCICAGKTGSQFAYTRGCLLKETFLDYFISMNHSAEQHNLFYCQDCPLERCKGKISSGKCKGHVVRKFIKECWYKCGCSMKCGNRVVQRGITAKLQVFRTPEHKGWGLRTLEDIPRGAFICEYVGEVITNRELFERSMQITGDKLTYPVLLDADWSSKAVLKDEEALCLDATVYGNVARFINHRCCDANMVQVPVEVETPDHHYYHLAFFTARKVNALEELTWDYGIDFNDKHPVTPFKCLCGSKFCRDRKSVKRSLR